MSPRARLWTLRASRTRCPTTSRTSSSATADRSAASTLSCAKYRLDKDPALAYMAKVIRGADTSDKTITPESVGVEALLEGVRQLHQPDDQRQREASRPILDALYADCQSKVGES